MKANIAKRVLVCSLSAVLLVASSTSALAAGTSAGTKAASSSSSSSSKKAEEIISSNVQSSSNNGGGSASVSVAQVPTTSAVAGVASTLPGVYLATNVRGTAITTGLTTISEGYSLAN